METVVKTDLRTLFSKQKAFASTLRSSKSPQRIDKLVRLSDYLEKHLDEARNATHSDFRKPFAETDLTEMYMITSEIKYTVKHLKRWLKPHHVPTPLSSIGTSAYIQYEPKGTSLIISPWNYPLSLAFKPLVSAIASGCTAIIKPSELTPSCSGFIAKTISDLFAEEEVAVVEGGIETSEALLKLPFDHIFFTGSPAVGKVVMEAASKNLTSVTLELGGKSPVIVDETADISDSAAKIAWGKLINNGQTCVAPDYVFIHKAVKNNFIRHFREAVTRMYGADAEAIEQSESYARIVNDRHFQRLQSLLDDAVAKDAKIILGGQSIPENRFIPPTLLDNVNGGMAILQEEIFGPLLPVLEYENLADVVQYINAQQKPLALYIFSKSRKNSNYLLTHTSAGNALVNEVLTQFGHHEIPFGGVNNSGIGKSNGFFGFKEFSHGKGIIKRKFGTISFMFPPYTERVKKLLKLMMKYT